MVRSYYAVNHSIDVYFYLFCVFRERRPTFVWRWMDPAAPATVAPGPGAVARAGHAATHRAAARGHRVTLPAVPVPALVLVPAPAPRFVFAMAAVLLVAWEETNTICIQFNVVFWMMCCCAPQDCSFTVLVAFLLKVWVSFSLSLFLFS